MAVMYQGVHNVTRTPEIPRRLPRGTHGLDRRLVVASQRTRLLEAVGQAVAEKGYAATTIDDIVRGAGVSKKTFYEHFRDKEDCFVSAYCAAADGLFERVRTAQGEPGDWLERTRAGVVAYLRWLAAEPALARVFLIEVAAAGPRAVEAREQVRDRYAELLAERQEDARGDFPALPELPAEIFHAVVAAVDDIVVREIREGGAEDLLRLEPIIRYLQVSLLAGPEVAARSSDRPGATG
jgi:AcrR family transcriptional regulator